MFYIFKVSVKRMYYVMAKASLMKKKNITRILEALLRGNDHEFEDEKENRVVYVSTVIPLQEVFIALMIFD
jgi:hypothetical protein